jgi:pimeloyl-ACP methyl ester carboxylesterase
MITDLQVPMTFWDGHGQVHIGFLEALNHVWHSLKAALNAISGPVFYTGHSLGAALATMAAARAQSDTKLGNPAAIYTFGSPRVGDAGFRKNFGSVFHARIVNDCDIVTSMPPVLALPTCPLYQHCGQEHRLLASGAMETGVENSDTVAERTVAGRIGDLVGNVVSLMKSAAGERGIPQHLIDHTPQNYTARLEKLPAYSNGKPAPPAPV